MPYVPTATVRKYNIKHLWDNSREVIRLSAMGLKGTEIAEMTGLTPAMVSNIRNSPIARERINELQDRRDEKTTEIARNIHEGAIAASELMRDIAKGKVEAPLKLQVTVARDLLGRDGYVAPTRVTDERQPGLMTTQDVITLVNRAKSAGAVVEEASYHDLTQSDGNLVNPAETETSTST